VRRGAAVDTARERLVELEADRRGACQRDHVQVEGSGDVDGLEGPVRPERVAQTALDAHAQRRVQVRELSGAGDADRADRSRRERAVDRPRGALRRERARRILEVVARRGGGDRAAVHRRPQRIEAQVPRAEIELGAQRQPVAAAVAVRVAVRADRVHRRAAIRAHRDLEVGGRGVVAAAGAGRAERPAIGIGGHITARIAGPGALAAGPARGIRGVGGVGVADTADVRIGDAATAAVRPDAGVGRPGAAGRGEVAVAAAALRHDLQVADRARVRRALRSGPRVAAFARSGPGRDRAAADRERAVVAGLGVGIYEIVSPRDCEPLVGAHLRASLRQRDQQTQREDGTNPPHDDSLQWRE